MILSRAKLDINWTNRTFMGHGSAHKWLKGLISSALLVEDKNHMRNVPGNRQTRL